MAGVMYARHWMRFTIAGMEIVRISGATPFRTGSLFSA